MRKTTLVAAWAALPLALLAAGEFDVTKFDPHMAAEKSVVTNGMRWIDGRYLPLEGRMFDDTESYYDRLPSNVTTKVCGGVRSMKHHTSGMQFRFSTDSGKLVFRWKPYYPAQKNLAMHHMPSTGVSGIDVYRYDETKGGWRYMKTGYMTDGEKGGELEVRLKPNTPCLVNLPLYNGISEFSLGIEEKAKISALPVRKSGIVKPVVFYGTSITHGGCASRPGMGFVNLVGRQCDVPVVDLGFSGNGRMEDEMCDHVSRIDASCYVLDCLWNMNKLHGGPNAPDEADLRAAGVTSKGGSEELVKYFKCRYEPFIRKLRKLRPNVPIVMAEQCDVFMGGKSVKDKFIRDLYERLLAEGWKNLVYLPKEEMYNGDGEGTVDGCHPNDWGMMSMAKAYGSAVKEALNLK